MTSFAKRLSESVLDTVTKELKPDVPTHNRLKRSWEEHEKRKFCRTRRLRNEAKQIQLRTKRSLQALTAVDSSSEPDPAWTGERTSIPGFRYKANGSARQSVADPRKTSLMKSLIGLSKHLIKKGSPRKSTVPPVFQKPSMERFSSHEVLDKLDRDEVRTTNSKKPNTKSTTNVGQHGRPGAFVLSDEGSAHRVRKVQEQLGLSGAHPYHRPYHHPARNDSLKDLGDLQNALKALHVALRSSDTHTTPKLPDLRVKQLEEGDKEKQQSATTITSCEDNNSTTNIPSCTTATTTTSTITTKIMNAAARPHRHLTLRDRCRACQNAYRSDVRELVQCANPYTHTKPRWRTPPSGQYVAPPMKLLRLTYPEYFCRTKSGSVNSLLGKNQSHQSSSSVKDTGFPPIDSRPRLRMSQSQNPCQPTLSQPRSSQRSLPVPSCIPAHKRPGGPRQEGSSRPNKTEVLQSMMSMMETSSRCPEGVPCENRKGASANTANNRDSFCVLKMKNSEEAEALKKRMQTFLGSLESWPRGL